MVGGMFLWTFQNTFGEQYGCVYSLTSRTDNELQCIVKQERLQMDLHILQYFISHT